MLTRHVCSITSLQEPWDAGIRPDGTRRLWLHSTDRPPRRGATITVNGTVEARLLLPCAQERTTS